MKAIELKNVSEKYRIKFIEQDNIQWEEIWALNEISFAVNKGEALGIIGHNGAGKTTLLKLISGMLVPDEGTINVSGRVSALMELGAGFNPEFTGRENIAANARMYGLDENNLNQQVDNIIEFAELGRFIDAPIKYYSQGMYVRLAFAMAIFVDPDVLLIDDILAVGDEHARQKCLRKIFELKESGKTIIMVTHDMAAVSKLCGRVMLLEEGKIVKDDTPQRVVHYYLEMSGNKKGIGFLEKNGARILFNNGKIILSHNDNLLTKSVGGYVCFFNPSVKFWFTSSDLFWEVKNLSIGKMIAEGKTGDGVVSQVWILEVSGEGFRWEAAIKEPSIKEAHVDLFFLPEHRKWLTLNKEESFPIFASKSNWQDLWMGNPGKDGIIGLVDDESHSFRGITLETHGENSQIRLFNTGYDQEARVIRVYFVKNRIISLNISIFSEKEKLRDHIECLRRSLALRQKTKEEKLRFRHTLTSGDMRLFADVENKALRLYYKEEELTKAGGAHSAFINGASNYNSSYCEWNMEREDGALILRLSWELLKVSQRWRFSFEDANLIWEIDFFSDSDLSMNALKFGLAINPEYKEFFCGCQEADFPEISTAWQDMVLEDERAELLGVRKTSVLPGIVLNNKNKLNCVIQNSDSESLCRILQVSLPKESLKEKELRLAIELNIAEDDSFVKAYIKDKQEQYKLWQEAERARLTREHTLTSGDMRLFADVENKALRLYYKEEELTRNEGLYTEMYVKEPGEWICPSFASWQVEKISAKEMVVTLKYEVLALSQRWIFACKDKEENSLDISIDIELNKPLNLSNKFLTFEYSDEYSKWLTEYERGDFSAIQYINGIAPIRLKDNRLSQIILDSDVGSATPRLLFQSTFSSEKQVLHIYKRKDSDREHNCLNFSLIIPNNESSTPPGRHIYYKGRITAGQNTELGMAIGHKNTVDLNSGNLRLFFEQGKGRIFYAQRELTSGLGIYTSVRSNGIWYDSSQAVWEVKNICKDEITAQGNWPCVPISQSWRISLIDKAVIFWTVEMDIYEKMNLEIEQASLMLCRAYKNWEIPKAAKGELVDEFTQDYDILPFRFWYGIVGDGNGISASGGILPRIDFICGLKDDSIRGMVENTDYLHKARLIQYQRTNIRAMPIKYRYFQGAIKIES